MPSTNTPATMRRKGNQEHGRKKGGHNDKTPPRKDRNVLPHSIFDYEKQAWVQGGRWVNCEHPESLGCECYGRQHAGEPLTPEDTKRIEAAEAANKRYHRAATTVDQAVDRLIQRIR